MEEDGIAEAAMTEEEGMITETAMTEDEDMITEAVAIRTEALSRGVWLPEQRWLSEG